MRSWLSQASFWLAWLDRPLFDPQASLSLSLSEDWGFGGQSPRARTRNRNELFREGVCRVGDRVVAASSIDRKRGDKQDKGPWSPRSPSPARFYFLLTIFPTAMCRTEIKWIRRRGIRTGASSRRCSVRSHIWGAGLESECQYGRDDLEICCLWRRQKEVFT